MPASVQQCACMCKSTRVQMLVQIQVPVSTGSRPTGGQSGSDHLPPPNGQHAHHRAQDKEGGDGHHGDDHCGALVPGAGGSWEEEQEAEAGRAPGSWVSVLAPQKDFRSTFASQQQREQGSPAKHSGACGFQFSRGWAPPRKPSSERGAGVQTGTPGTPFLPFRWAMTD